MTAREFFYLTSNMRAAQQAYFKNRKPETLRAARRLEREVDAEISRVKLILKDRDNEAGEPHT